MAKECTQAWGPSFSVSSPASDSYSYEFDHATEQSSPSLSPVASVPVSTQSAPGVVPTTDDSDNSRLQLPCLFPLLPFLFLLPCLPPLLLVTDLLLLQHLLLIQLPLLLLLLPRLFLLQLLCLSLPLVLQPFLTPRCLLLPLLLPVITSFLSFLVIRILLTESR